MFTLNQSKEGKQEDVYDMSVRPKADPFRHGSRILSYSICLIAVAMFVFLVHLWEYSGEGVPYVYSILYRAVLSAHEFGYIVLSPFGINVNLIGGSLLQIVVPAFAVYFFSKHRLFLFSSFSLFFVGDNILNIAHHVANVQINAATLPEPIHIAPLLELINNRSSLTEYDWHALFATMNVFNYTNTISMYLYIIGWEIIFLALIGCLLYSKTLSKKR